MLRYGQADMQGDNCSIKKVIFFPGNGTEWGRLLLKNWLVKRR